MSRLAYARYWLRFKVVNLIRPHTSLLPASREARWSIRFHGYGFVAFKPYRSLSVSWRTFAEGPCNYATFIWLRDRRNA